MNITEFAALAAEKTETFLREDRHEDVQVKPMEIMKLNDQSLHGVTIVKEDEPAPTYYLDEMFRKYECGADLDLLIRELADTYIEGRTCWPMPAEEIPDMKFKTVRRRAGLRLVGMEFNRKFLRTVPYRDVGCGYALICEVQMKASDGGLFSTVVTNEMAKENDYDMDKLFDAALENAWKSNAASFRGVQEILQADSPAYGAPVKDPSMKDSGGKRRGRQEETCYVLTTDRQMFGAAALFYPGTQAMIAHVLDEDYFAIPSSVHEFLIIPASRVPEPAHLCKLVKEANAIVVSPGEVLSNDVLKYSRSTRTLSLLQPDQEVPVFDAGNSGTTEPAWLAV